MVKEKEEEEEGEEEGEIEFVESTGNPFIDLGFENPEEALAKSEIASEIHNCIKRRRLTQAQAAEIMGVDQPKVSEITRGKLSKYSLDRLFRFLLALGNNINISVNKHIDKKTRPSIFVTGQSCKNSNSKRL